MGLRHPVSHTRAKVSSARQSLLTIDFEANKSAGLQRGPVTYYRRDETRYPAVRAVCIFSLSNGFNLGVHLQVDNNEQREALAVGPITLLVKFSRS